MHTATSDYGEPTTEAQFIRPACTPPATQPCKPPPVTMENPPLRLSSYDQHAPHLRPSHVNPRPLDPVVLDALSSVCHGSWVGGIRPAGFELRLVVPNPNPYSLLLYNGEPPSPRLMGTLSGPSHPNL